MKAVVKLETYYIPGELKLDIGKFVEHYNYHPYHQSLDNLTPVDVYFSRAAPINQARKRLKAQMLLRSRNVTAWVRAHLQSIDPA